MSVKVLKAPQCKPSQGPELEQARVDLEVAASLAPLQLQEYQVAPRKAGGAPLLATYLEKTLILRGRRWLEMILQRWWRKIKMYVRREKR